MAMDDTQPTLITRSELAPHSAPITGSALKLSYTYRILIIAPTPFFVDRGGHVQIYEQARALLRLGNLVELCTYHIGRDMPEIPTHRIRKVPWYTKTDAGPAWGKLYLMVLLFFLVWKVMRDYKPDVLHAHGWDGCWIAYALRLLTGVPFVFNMQGSFTGEIVEHRYAKTNSLFFKLLLAIENWTLQLGPIITPSKALVDFAHRKIPPQRVYRVYDGVDSDDLEPDIDPGSLRAELIIPADRKVIVFLGLLKTYQGIDILLEALHILVHELKFTRAHCLIMGFPDVDKYVARARELSIDVYTTFPGRIDYKQRKYYYALGDVAVAPKLSTVEGNGKIYDYLAMGLPIVAFDCAVTREILGALAFYAEMGNAYSLAQALRTALTDESRAAELGRRGRTLALERYSWLSVGRRVMKAYDYAVAPAIYRRKSRN